MARFLLKGEKRKIDLGKSVDYEIVSFRTSTTRLFEEISSEMKAIQELLSEFLMRSKEPFTAPHFYVLQTDFWRFLDDLKW